MESCYVIFLYEDLSTDRTYCSKAGTCDKLWLPLQPTSSKALCIFISYDRHARQKKRQKDEIIANKILESVFSSILLFVTGFKLSASFQRFTTIYVNVLYNNSSKSSEVDLCPSHC